jgi:hypothetical protein
MDRFLSLFSLLLGIAGCMSNAGIAAETAQPVESATLHNVFKVDPQVYSGDAPEDEF